MIPFNKPFLTGKETDYITQAVQSGKISGNGMFTQKCHEFFQAKYGFKKCLLTTSCTDALEMCAMLIDCKPGDEVIVPSYTFVSSALAFVRQGAKIVFADSQVDSPNIDVTQLEALITGKTKAIVVVHYAGIAVDMDAVMQLANRHNLVVIEDAAQSIDSYYKTRPLGSIGHLAAFSFHETKNVISGEGGMLAINDEQYIKRSEIIWEKGTNRASFFRGEVNKYSWVDTGSSFLPSEIIAAFLYAQLEQLDKIQIRRKQIWNKYHDGLVAQSKLGSFKIPVLPDYATNNAHMFYLVCNSIEDRSSLIEHLKNEGIWSVFHYLSLHKSDYYKDKHDGRVLTNADKFESCLVRLPFYFELTDEQLQKIIQSVISFYK
ncbi:MAG: dTDP-4-amino-4,6-dideoxygalactose transaminase [Sphingobacteriaceae bacterium]|nr:MAG: dTDP-4-amino-4,6-dideoxygalactose transaminase [Sphingobacteriaceae bacterium]